MTYIDPTKSRIARDNEERRRECEAGKPDLASQFAKAAFREAAGKGRHGAMKTTEAGYKAAAKNPRKAR